MAAVSTLEAMGATPLVELDALSPVVGARILAKWEGANPTGSTREELAPGQRVVEYTGGTTGTSMAMVCAALDHAVTLLTADCFATEKIRRCGRLGPTLGCSKHRTAKSIRSLSTTDRSDLTSWWRR